MADETASPKPADAKDQARNSNEVALEMMKFIAVTTGYGKGPTSSTGFSGKPSRTAEEYAESLITLFERCRSVIDQKTGN
jgi:hypothetical protein